MDSSFAVDELASHTRNLIKFVLNNVSSKLPIKQTELMEITNIKNKIMFDRALSQAKNFLQDSHGLNLVEVPDLKTKQFIVISTVNAGGSELDFTDKQKSEITLLFLILSYIFMKGHLITEDNLVQYLSKLKISVDESHPFFGENIKKTISQTFVKQLYLKREKDNSVAAVAEDNYLYSWGSRSSLEFPKEKVLETVAQILGKPKICFVRQQMDITGKNENYDVDVEMK